MSVKTTTVYNCDYCQKQLPDDYATTNGEGKTKVEDMIVYGNICLKQFPKHERYALASEIRLCMYRILGIVIETNHKHYKKTTLTELDIEVDKLRSYLRLSANPELKYLSVDKYGNWAAMVDEIGRMVGGWIQSVSK